VKHKVWFSPAFTDPRLFLPFCNDVAEADQGKIVEVQKQLESGKPLAPESLPRSIWANEAENGSSKFHLPDLFMGFGVWVVSTRCAEVLRRFDMGAGGLHPVGVYQTDKTTPLGDGWFCLVFGNVKDGILPALSPNLTPNGGRRLALLGIGKDMGIALTSAVLAGPDIWIDVNLPNGFFVSGELAAALKKERCASGFSLRQCAVIN